MGDFSVNELRVILGLARRLARVAPNRRLAAANALMIVLIWAQDKNWLRLPRTPYLRLAYLGEQFKLAAANRSEVEVAREMLLDEQYLLDGIDPAVIVDLGSNVGASIMFFRVRYPRARIVGLEPDPRTFERLWHSVSHVPGVEVYPWAVADRTGKVPFRQVEQSWESALYLGDGDAATVEVDAVSLTELLSRLEIGEVDLLKLDVEGAEWLIFDQESALMRCKAIVGELHLDAPDQTGQRALAALRDFDVVLDASRTASRVNFIARRTTAPTSRDLSGSR
jgi:FkbM family methyltransferase